MSKAPDISDLDRDGLEEYLARDFPMEPQGAPLITAETIEIHYSHCTGCLRCWRVDFKGEK